MEVYVLLVGLRLLSVNTCTIAYGINLLRSEGTCRYIFNVTRVYFWKYYTEIEL